MKIGRIEPEKEYAGKVIIYEMEDEENLYELYFEGAAEDTNSEIVWEGYKLG